MMRRGLTALALLGLAACSAAPPAAEAPVTRAESPPRTAAPSPRDRCGASELAYLVGKNRTEIPVPVDPALRRVACTTCPMTMDFNPGRLNILFDAGTGVIREVKCG